MQASDACEAVWGSGAMKTDWQELKLCNDWASCMQGAARKVADLLWMCCAVCLCCAAEELVSSRKGLP